MPFLRFSSKRNPYCEWGFEISDGSVPAIGDTVNLFYSKSNDVDADLEIVEGIITKREWYFPGDDDIEVCLEVELGWELPEGYAPDSEAWPAAECAKRQKEDEQEPAPISQSQLAVAVHRHPVLKD